MACACAEMQWECGPRFTKISSLYFHVCLRPSLYLPATRLHISNARPAALLLQNTLVIMTSNLGSSEIFAQLDAEAKEGGKALTDEERRAAVKDKVMEHVR